MVLFKLSERIELFLIQIETSFIIKSQIACVSELHKGEATRFRSDYKAGKEMQIATVSRICRWDSP